MKNASLILIGVLFVAGLAWTMSYRYSRLAEPVYQGKPLSAWLTAFDPANRDQFVVSQRDARRAVREIGTNCIPTLFRMLRAKDSPLKVKLIALMQKQHVVAIHFHTDTELHREAMRAFWFLGARAQGAVPDLVKMDKEILTPDAHFAITNTLEGINYSQMPNGAIMWGLGHNAASERVRAFNELAEGGTGFSRAVPMLLEKLGNPDADIYWVKFALEAIDPDTAARVLPKPATDPKLPDLRPSDFERAMQVRNVTVGNWSEPVDGAVWQKLHGRLLLYEVPRRTDGSATSIANSLVDLELQDVSGINAPVPAAVYYDVQDGLRFELRDAKGNPASPGPPRTRSSFPRPYWVIVPPDGSAQLHTDLQITSNSQVHGFCVSSGQQSWLIRAGDTNFYFLSASFSPPTNHSNPLEYDVWGGTLSLPSVKLQIQTP